MPPGFVECPNWTVKQITENKNSHTAIQVDMPLRFLPLHLFFLDTARICGYTQGALEMMRKEDSMVHISPKAQEVLTEYFKNKEIAPIRIFLQTGG
jgi:hypothetical protein